MNWIAWRILTGDLKKYAIIVFGVAFASLLIGHQASVFFGVMRRTTSQIWDVLPDGIWVMDSSVEYIDEVRPLPASSLRRVRGVTGVEWSVPFYKGTARSRTEGGTYRQAILLGLDDNTLVGAPQKMIAGRAADLWNVDAVIVDQAGYSYYWPNEPIKLGRTLELNDRRAVLVGVCEVSPPFQTVPVIYTRYSLATQFAALERRKLSFLLVKPRPEVSAEQLCQRIQDSTGLMALTGRQFIWRTVRYYFRSTGIPLNFGIVVSLGFVVGIAVAGQTFYLFTIENLKHFGLLKAVGVTGSTLVRMILLQAFVVSLIGFSLGIGMAAVLLEVLSKTIVHLAGFYLPWQIVVVTALSIATIMVASSLLSIRRAIVLEPVLVFR